MKTLKSIIYMYGFSTWNHSQMQNLMDIIHEHSALDLDIKLVLLHDGVIGISTKGQINPLMYVLLNLPITIYALIPDIKARGIDVGRVHKKIKTIEYEELVDLLVDSPKIVSWM